jgi:hypothetical protein
MDSPLLKSIFLPPSVEVIGPTSYPFISALPQYSARDNSHFCFNNDCFLGANGRHLIQYQGTSPRFRVIRDISFLSDGAFLLHPSLTTLVFDSPSRIKFLPAHCFTRCAGLRFVEIPKSVLVIGNRCFYMCSALIQIAFESPATVRRIETHAFWDCPHLATFTVPSSVSTLGNFVFYHSRGLSSVTFEEPSHLTNIPDGLFQECPSLTRLDLPNSVAKITGSAFLGSCITSVTGASCTMCDSLLIRADTIFRCFGSPSKITIPSTVREIGQSAFCDVRSLEDLGFEEGLLRVGTMAFQNCDGLKTLAFPASLEVIGEEAFSYCRSLSHLTFVPGSQLQCISKFAFADCSLKTVILPGTVREIDPRAFRDDIWQLVKFDGPPPILLTGAFLFSADSRILLRNVPRIPRAVVRELIVPSSVETLGDRCFENCEIPAITFQNPSMLRKIGERSFARSALTSITIPASTEEIDGSAFVDCPLSEIRIAPGSRTFKIEAQLLMTSDGTAIVKYFGHDLEVIVPNQVEILGNSCFEGCSQVERVLFENGSKLRRIGRSSVSNCTSLASIEIPASVAVIGESAFKGCHGLESCLIDQDASLVRIEKEAFSECCSLRSFYVPLSVELIGEKCFNKCDSLHRLRFASDESLKTFVGDLTLDDVLEHVGLDEVSAEFRFEFDQGAAAFEFAGWSPV